MAHAAHGEVSIPDKRLQKQRKPLASRQQRRYDLGAVRAIDGGRGMANGIIGLQHDDNTVTAVECLQDGEIQLAGSTLYSCYSDREKVEALVSFGTVQQLGASLAKTSFIAKALRTNRHKPLRFRNRNEYARSAAGRTQNAFLMLKNGEWRMLDGVGTRGNPRWPSVRRVLGERGFRVPGTTTKYDDHRDPAVIFKIEALVWGAPSNAATAPAAQPNPAPQSTAKDVLAPITIEVV